MDDHIVIALADLVIARQRELQDGQKVPLYVFKKSHCN